MDINNNQQLNTFESGMNMDTADYVLPKNLYRQARNVRLIANKGSNSAELHLIDGNKLIFTLDDLVEEWEDWRILATNSCRNIGVIIIQNDSYWNIIKLTVDDKDNITKELVFVDSITDKLNESCVDTVIRYEAEDNIKLYIADSEKPLLLVNIATTQQELSIDDMYSYPQASLDAPKFAGIGDNGTLTAGLYQYAYLLYNKNGLSTEMSRTTKLIPLVNQGSSWWSTGYEKGYGNKSIVIKISIADTKMTKIRVYRIKYIENGQTPTIELIKDQNITANDMYVTDSGLTALSTITLEEFNSISGVHIIPKCIESKYDYLFAAGIKQQDVDLVEVAEFDTRTYSFQDTSPKDAQVHYFNAVVDENTAASFNSTNFASVVRKLIDKLSDINTTANCIQPAECKYAPVFYTDDDGYEDYYIAYGGIGKNISWHFIKTSLDADYTDETNTHDKTIRSADVSNTATYIGGSSGALYNAVKKTTDLYIGEQYYSDCDSNNRLQLGSNAGLIRKNPTANQWLSPNGITFKAITTEITHGNTPIYTDDEWVNGYIAPYTEGDLYGGGYTKLNYANPKISYLFKSLRRGETYRFGIIFYNKYGSASKVKWIQDITVPELYEDGFETFSSRGKSHLGGSIDLTVRPLGILFDITGKLPDGVVGYEIVRCNRNIYNIKNIMLGVLSRPLRRHGYISSTEVSSSTYCPSGYLTTARFIQGPTGYYWNRIQSDITLTDEWRYYPYEADNFDNYNTYQFVSAETTYQSETIKSAISSIGETNLSLNGLKFVFGQNMSAPLYYAKRTELAESKHYYPYQAAAGVIEMGRGNSFLHLPQSYYNEIDGVVGDEVNPDKLLTFCATSYWERESRVIEKSASFLGLDVICDWNGGEFRTSRIPFWWSGVSVIGEKTASWSRVMTNGYARYNIESDVTVIPDETQSVYQSYATKTQYVSMLYVKLYEQSSNVTYRTPVTLTVGGDSVKTVTSLGHCVNAHTQKSDNSNVRPVFDKTLIDVTSGSDFSHAYSTQPNNVSAKISSAHMANTIEKDGLFNTLESGKAATFNMSTTSVHGGVSFFNATVASVYGLDIETGICETGDFVYSWGHDCEERKFTQDLCTGGPCLVIQTTETSSDQSIKATFSNVSAAINIDAVSSYLDNISELTQRAQTYVPTAYGIMIQPWYTTYTQYEEGHGWAGGGTSTGNLVNDAYGSYDFLRISDNTGTSTLGSLEPIFKHSIGGTMLCNISHTPQIYNGTTYAERQLDTYYSYGDYHDVSDTTAVVFNGDCYISILEYVSAHKIENPATMYPETGDVNKYSFFKTPPTKTVVYAIPLETSINVDYEYGFSISRALADGEDQKQFANPQLKPYVSGDITQSTPMYLYNTVYSSNPSARLFAAETEDDTEESSKEFDYRCYYSNVKENNETVDSWVKFQSSNYLDVDTKYGSINRLRTFNNQLLFWQDSAFGLFDVNEQRVLQDVNNQNLILGEGGVLQRYTYFSTLHGMKDGQQTDTHSSNLLYWYDHDNNMIMSYATGSAPVELSNIRNMRSYLTTDTNILRDKITSTYERDYNEVYFNIFKGSTLTYSEDQLVFISINDSADSDIHYMDFNTFKLSIAVNQETIGGETNLRAYKENSKGEDGSTSFGKPITPSVTYIANQPFNMVKVFDITTFGGHFDNTNSLNIKYTTPHGQESTATGDVISDREWDYRVCIPRNNDADYGNRMRDKVLECTLSSNSNSDDFSLEYVITKYRISWS